MFKKLLLTGLLTVIPYHCVAEDKVNAHRVNIVTTVSHANPEVISITKDENTNKIEHAGDNLSNTILQQTHDELRSIVGASGNAYAAIAFKRFSEDLDCAPKVRKCFKKVIEKSVLMNKAELLQKYEPIVLADVGQQDSSAQHNVSMADRYIQQQHNLFNEIKNCKKNLECRSALNSLYISLLLEKSITS